MMRAPRRLLGILSLMILCACKGGGGSKVGAAPPWPKFRHDANNTAQATGAVAANQGTFKWPTPGVLIDGSPISASPAIALDGTLYVGSEGGTLAAVNADGTIKWTFDCCASCGTTCPSSGPALGPLKASPSVYTLNDQNNVFVGSSSGNFYIVADEGTAGTCTGCFQPTKQDATISAASFDSSPTFTTNADTLAVTAIFVGAAIRRTGSSTPAGKVYAINNDGSFQWVFPRSSDIVPLTSSPALGVGSSVYLSTETGGIYALTTFGSLLWHSAGLASLPGATNALTPSAITTADTIYTAAPSGDVFAVNPDGSFRWQLSLPGESFTSSLAIGAQNFTTPTPTFVQSPTPTPVPNATATATPSPTVMSAQSTLFGITKQGTLVVVAANTGDLIPPSGPLPISGGVQSSPALSDDGFLVFGSDDGLLYAISTITTGAPAGTWPVPVTHAAIRSSPAIANDGSIYVGADDGRLYAVGAP